MSAATLTTQNYSPDSVLALTFNVAESYDLTGKSVVFEIVDDAGVVAFRYSSGTDAQLAISGQVVTLAIEPDTESEDDIGNTLAEAMQVSRHRTNRSFNLDFQSTGSATVDYRVQGDFDVLPTHGPIS